MNVRVDVGRSKTKRNKENKKKAPKYEELWDKMEDRI
jgi:hypothetical protein